jgi:hypothetical protein
VEKTVSHLGFHSLQYLNAFREEDLSREKVPLSSLMDMNFPDEPEVEEVVIEHSLSSQESSSSSFDDE